MIGTVAAQQQEDVELSRRSLGDNYASLLALSQKALAQRLDSTPEVIRQLELDRTQILSNAEYAHLERQSKPTSEEVSQYYSAHAPEFDQVQIRRLFIWKKHDGSSPQKGLDDSAATALASKIRQTFATGGDARKLVGDNQNVVLDYDPLSFGRGELPEYMEKPAFSNKEGEWTVLEDKPDALILLQVVKHDRRSLKDASPQIEKKLQAQKLRAALDDVKKDANIWMDPQYFAAEAASANGEERPASIPPQRQPQGKGNGNEEKNEHQEPK